MYRIFAVCLSLRPTVCLWDFEVEIFTGRIFQTGSGPDRMVTILARPDPKYRKKISARARSEREIEI